MSEHRPWVQWRDGPADVVLAMLGHDNPDALAWQDSALCAQTDPEAFFPEKGGSTRDAKSVCRRCEVREECLQYALDHDDRFGIYGGLSPKERRPLQREHYRRQQQEAA